MKYKFFTLHLICFYLFTTGVSTLLAAPVNVQIKLTNQYEKTLENLKIERINADNTVSELAFEYSKVGVLSFSAEEDDSIHIYAENAKDLRFSVAHLAEKKHITLSKKFTLSDLVNPLFYIHYGGLWVLLAIVFAETGLFLGFFLPGDSLLFVAGVFSQNLAKSFIYTDSEFINLLLVMLLVFTAGVLGNWVGFVMGYRSGKFFYNMKDSWYFKKKYLDQAHEFYEKNGGGAIILARFLPIIRTFAPIVAGIVKMNKAKFMVYNIMGCVAWVLLLVGGGHYLDAYIRKKFEFELKDHLEAIIIVIVAITTLPIIWKMVVSKVKKAVQ